MNTGNGLALDSSGNVYLADGSAVLKVTSTGTVTTFAGDTEGGGKLSLVVGVAVDAAGNVYAADNGNNEIFKISSGGAITSLASITNPIAVVVDHDDNIYAIGGQNSDKIYKIVSGTATMFASCTLNGGGDNCGLSTLAVNSAGDLLALDATAGTVGLVPAGGGTMTTLFPILIFADDGTSGSGMASDGAGNVFFTGSLASILEESP